MRITWLGHSCFLLTGDKGSVLTDPYHDYVGFSMPQVSADAVLLSHHHRDHDYIEGVDGASYVVDKAGKAACGAYEAVGTPCFHDKSGGRDRGSNLVFNITVDGVSLCHLGDLGERTDAVSKVASGVDVLFIPVGGRFTIDGDEAAEFVKEVKPRYAVPMHYQVGDCAFDISGAERFISHFIDKDVVYLDGNSFDISSNDAKAEGTTILVFKK